MLKLMAARTLLFVSIIAFAFQGCSKNVNLTSPEDAKTGTTQLGKFAVNFDKSEVPTDVNSIKVYLSRKGCDTLKAEIPVIRDSTSQQVLQAAFDSVTAGVWNVQVDAFNSKNEVIFTGSAEIFVASGVLTQVELTMKRIKASVGQVLIKIKWESESASLWKDYGNNPILTTSNSFWDYAGVFTPRILYDNNTYKMWYGGLSSAGSAYVGYAYSSDGENWVSSKEPVLTPGEKGKWDDGRATIGPVININGVYHMYYQGWSAYSTEFNGIGLATSTDGISWTKHPKPVLSYDAAGEYSLTANSVIKVDDSYYMYYCYYSFKKNAYMVGLAISKDGTSWTRYSGNPVLVSSQSWEEGMGVGNVTVYKQNNKLKMVYSGMSSLSVTGFGAAESNDGIKWVKSSDNPVFADTDPSISWNTSRLLYPVYTVVNGQERIYYTGKDPDSGILSIAYLLKK